MSQYMVRCKAGVTVRLIKLTLYNEEA